MEVDLATQFGPKLLSTVRQAEEECKHCHETVTAVLTEQEQESISVEGDPSSANMEVNSDNHVP